MFHKISAIQLPKQDLHNENTHGHTNMDGEFHEVPPLYEELHAIHDC